jgi:Domain of unknown function (DUF397)
MDMDRSAAIWKKSRYSNGSANCVEIATNFRGRVAVRDSKDPDGPILVFTTSEWDAFLRMVNEGDASP